MSVAKLIKQDMQTDDFWSGIAKLEFVVAINKSMKEKNISKSDLARLIGKSPAYITKIMTGDVNLTIESMVMITRAVDMRYSPTIIEEPVMDRPSKVVSLPYRPVVQNQQVYCHAQG
jgi:predicted transcriptional regulator